MKTAHAVLSGAIDYAGLFPPAGLDLATTVCKYGGYREGEDAWALGRLVLPAGSLAGFRSRLPVSAVEWPLSVLLGPEWQNDVRLAEQLGIRLDTVEFKPSGVEQIRNVRRALPAGVRIFFEVGCGPGQTETLAAIADAGACAKIRTGGVTPGAIPSVADVIGFLVGCARYRLAFKATAGLHHALRAIHPLTYDESSERAPMHGFVNVILAASVVYAGGDPQLATAVLDDDSHTDFRFRDDCVHWCDQSFSVQMLAEVRDRFMLSFGSCSFTEPLGEMRQMRWL